MEFKELTELGLTEGEIKVYIALLRLGLSTKGPVAHEAGISESKIYEVLERLKDKGIVMFVKKKKGTKEVAHFKAANPVLLKDFLQKKRDELDKEEKLLDSLLPSLTQQLEAVSEEFSAVIYEGIKGIMTNNKEVLEMMTPEHEWLGMGIKSDKPHAVNQYWISFFHQRAQKGTRMRLMFVDRETWYFKETKKVPHTKVRCLPGISPAAVAVYKDRVMIFKYGTSPGCLAITNKDVADSFKGFFESLWKMAEK